MPLKIKQSELWNLHVHSRFSSKDALPAVEDIVSRARALGQPGLGLTDHGNMAGSVQLYQECAKQGILAFPGSELYMVESRKDQRAKRAHLVVVAYTSEGYRNLVGLSTLTHRNFFHKPLIDLDDLAGLAEAGRLRGIAASTACVSGLVARSVLGGNDGAARSYLRVFATWFDKLYVELQNHNNIWPIGEGLEVTDDQLADHLLEMAREEGLPVVITQDSHYLEIEDRADHDALKRLVSFGPDADDGVFGGDGYGLGDEAWFQAHHHRERYRAGVEGLQDLLAAHDLEIPQLDHYAYNIPFTVERPYDELVQRVRSLANSKGASKRHLVRLEEELEIIRDTGMAGYLLLVAEVTDWCREHQILYQARGSAAGSMCCWLLGITPVDPLKWQLSFDRFLSRDRTKPPDIDLDIEHTRRQELIDWLGERFSIGQIGNWRLNKLSGEIDPDTGETTGKGSLRVQYFARIRQLGEHVGEWKDVPDEDKQMLSRLDELETYSGYGKHAAGIILTTSRSDLDGLVPMMYIASSESFVSQYPMDDIEALGLVKLDVLGLKTLSVLHRTLDNLGWPIDLDRLPSADSRTYAAIASGNTDGIFQLEGWTARKGVQRLQPTSIADVIAAMALFRPATMDSGATADYIKRKHKRERRPERHELLDSVTKETHGIFLYQEQVISVLRSLGMDPDSLTKFLKAVKASNQNIGDAGRVIAGFQQELSERAKHAGISEEDWEWAWNAMTGFAAYGFNRAHSTVYGLTAFRCAYLMTHHPVAFHAGLLAVAAGTDKEEKYLRAVRERKLLLLRVDVEQSDVTYSVDKRGKAIRKGLMSVKGVGEKAAHSIAAVRPPGGFEQITKFGELVNHRKVSGLKPLRESNYQDYSVGVINKLNEAGALESIK